MPKNNIILGDSTMKNYTITEDPLFKNFIKSRPGLSTATKNNYKFVFTKLYYATNTPLYTLIENCKEEQNKVIEKIKTTSTDNEGNTIIEKTVTKFDVNKPDSYINICLDKFIEYCKEKNNSNTTINAHIEVIMVLLKYYNVEIPEINKLPKDAEPWNLLSKEDFKFIMQDSTLTHQTLISFLKDTGVRLKDALRFTIGDFMEWVIPYHTFVDVNDFIDNAPSDMVGIIQFEPHKTRRFHLKCVTGVSPETTNLMLQNLRRIKNEYLPKINKKYGLNLKLSKDDALFGNQREYFKGHISTHNISDIFNKKNKKLRDYHIKVIDEKIKNGELAAEDREAAISKIPKFHAHACRKFFQSTIAMNCGNLRICALMEGHSSPLRTDESYIKIDVEEVKEVYMSAMDDLSLENTEVKVYTSEIRKEMEAKMRELEEKNKQLESEVSEIDSIKDRLKTLEDNRPSWNEFIGEKNDDSK